MIHAVPTQHITKMTLRSPHVRALMRSYDQLQKTQKAVPYKQQEIYNLISSHQWTIHRRQLKQEKLNQELHLVIAGNLQDIYLVLMLIIAQMV